MGSASGPGQHIADFIPVFVVPNEALQIDYRAERWLLRALVVNAGKGSVTVEVVDR